MRQERPLLYYFGHWADRKSTIRTMTVADQYLLACVDVQSWSFVSFCVWKSRLGARRVCTECVKGWEKCLARNIVRETVRSSVHSVSVWSFQHASGQRQDRTTLPSESKSTFWKNQGLLAQNFVMLLPSKREASAGFGEQTIHWCSSAIEMTLTTYVRAEGLPNSLLSLCHRSIQRIWPRNAFGSPPEWSTRKFYSDETRNNFLFSRTESREDHWRRHPRNQRHPLRFRAESILGYDICAMGQLVGGSKNGYWTKICDFTVLITFQLTTRGGEQLSIELFVE